MPDKSWKETCRVYPHQAPGSITDNKPDGTRDVYLFYCEDDDGCSKVLKSRGGVDTADPSTRVVTNLAGFELVKTIHPREYFTMTILTDESQEPRKIRIKHF
ncbi:MAG: hypothetical protein HYS87_00180 [Candidatus Colwellbacteria bacterium]|nr:hypothetical protein [Candidatus Colwellbacteria bacterium]